MPILTKVLLLHRLHCVWACIRVYELNVQVLLTVYVHMYTYVQAGSLLSATPAFLFVQNPVLPL